ncbi:MAG TPA: hypothetical protein VKU60_17220 [Chloroflexota bacterium]|nr:hypothetical protein [Chloroflexota bacterium]
MPDNRNGDEPLPKYDFRVGVRGKYAGRYAEGTNLVLLAPDVANEFPDAEAVNNALRTLIDARKRAKAAVRRRAERREAGGRGSSHLEQR